MAISVKAGGRCAPETGPVEAIEDQNRPARIHPPEPGPSTPWHKQRERRAPPPANSAQLAGLEAEDDRVAPCALERDVRTQQRELDLLPHRRACSSSPR